MHLLSSSPNSLFLNLPPSYKGGHSCQNSLNGHSFMQPLIRYSVRAVVVPIGTEGRLIEREACASSRDISLKPFCMAPPPVEIADLPGDYRLSSTKSLKKSLWGKSIGYLE